MSLPKSGPQNFTSYKILASEISLATSLASGTNSVSSTFDVQGASLYVMAQLASGQMTVSIKTDSVTPITNPASGGNAVSVTLTPANNKNFLKLNSSDTLIYGAVKLTDVTWSSGLESLDILVAVEHSNEGFGWFNTDASCNNGTRVDSTANR